MYHIISYYIGLIYYILYIYYTKRVAFLFSSSSILFGNVIPLIIIKSMCVCVCVCMCVCVCVCVYGYWRLGVYRGLRWERMNESHHSTESRSIPHIVLCAYNICVYGRINTICSLSHSDK